MPDMNTTSAPAIEAHTADAEGFPMSRANRIALMRPEELERLEIRFWAKTEEAGETGCVVWTGAKATGGYGQFRLASGPVRAHQVSFVLAHGPIPAGFVVRHTCHDPLCVNPNHLIIGTQADNMRDMVDAGRSRRGPWGPNPWKLCAKGAHIIIGDNILGVPRNETAQALGVSMATIKAVRGNRAWVAAMTAHLDAELAKKPKKAKPRRS